MILIRLVVTVN